MYTNSKFETRSKRSI